MVPSVVGLDIVELASFVLLLLGASAIAGLVAGLLGVGGGIVIVPVLFYVLTALSYPDATLMHVCVATSLATIILTSARSVASHNKRGAVDWEILSSWGPWLAGGAALGVLISTVLETRALLAIFGVAAFAVSIQMAFGGAKAGALGDAPPDGLARVGWAGGNGVLSALMGIGGGTFGVPILSLYAVPIHRAVATSAGFGLAIAIPSVIGFVISGWGVEEKPPFTIGYVNMMAFLIIVPMTVLCAPLGVRLAHAMDPRPLKIAFALFLALTSLNMLRKALLG